MKILKTKRKATAKTFMINDELVERWNRFASENKHLSFTFMLNEAVDFWLTNKGYGTSIVELNKPSVKTVDAVDAKPETVFDDDWTEQEAEMAALMEANMQKFLSQK